MDKWRHRITIHSTADVLGILSEPLEETHPSMFCDDSGTCYLGPEPGPFAQAIERLLDEVGEEGWELVQMVFRPEQMIGFWKQPD